MKTTYIMEMDDYGRITATKELDHSGYQKGLEDAWKVAKRISATADNGGLNSEELEEIFDTCSAPRIFNNFTVTEAMEKLKAYEEGRFRVGDIVAGVSSCYGVVVRVNKLGCNVLWENGETGFHSSSDLDKVDGCTIDMKIVMSEIKNMKGAKS